MSDRTSPELADAPARRASYVLVLLFLVYLSNHIDRGILNILIQPIKEEFGASDLVMGLLAGPAFALFYATLGVPIARLADRRSRVDIIAVSVALWSAMTALSGAATSILSLAAMRVGVGVGEAGCSPPSHSLISDYFPRERRGRALGIYAMATQAGSAFGWLLGGWIFFWLGWRLAFAVAGLPGLLLAMLVKTTVPEPSRGAMESGPVDVEPLPMREALRHLLQQRSYVWLQFGASLNAIAGYGLAVWVAPFLARVHGLEIQEIGTWLGAIALCLGMPGTLLAGILCDRLILRDPRWYVGVPATSALLSTPFTVAFLFVESAPASLASYAVYSLLGLGFAAPTFAMIQAVVKVRARAFAVAVHLLLANLVGLGLGPVIIGGLNDALDDRLGLEAIRYTMLVAVLANVVAVVFYSLASRTLARDIVSRDR